MWTYKGQKRPPFANEPGPGEESVWDYPKPPKPEEDSRHIKVYAGEICIADSSNAVRILETASPPTFYIPPNDVKTEFLKATEASSHCEWKGKAAYFDVVTENRKLQQAAWVYKDPNDAFKKIQGYFSFYPSKLTCYVDGEEVKAQPGGFYGGWITSEIVGPVKGQGPHTYL